MNELSTQDASRIAAANAASPAQPARNAAPERSAPEPAGKPLPPQGDALPVAEQAEEKAAVDQAVVALNDYVQNTERNIRFTFDDDLGRSIVSVVDGETEQVIRQIPNDVVVRLARNLKTELEESIAPAVSVAGPVPADGSGNALSFIDTTA
jgi:flagellar protein FlaG